MALHLKACPWILLHIVGHLLYLLHRLRQQVGFTRLEEDVVGDKLSRLLNSLLYGGHRLLVAVIEGYGTFGNHNIADKRQVLIIEGNLETHPCGLVDTWEVNHALVVEINLQSSFVERQSHMVPALLERVHKITLFISIKIISML